MDNTFVLIHNLQKSSIYFKPLYFSTPLICKQTLMEGRKQRSFAAFLFFFIIIVIIFIILWCFLNLPRLQRFRAGLKAAQEYIFNGRTPWFCYCQFKSIAATERERERVSLFFPKLNSGVKLGCLWEKTTPSTKEKRKNDTGNPDGWTFHAECLSL